MFSRLLGMLSDDMAIDLGTANTLRIASRRGKRKLDRQPLGYFKAGHLQQLDVHEDQVWAMLARHTLCTDGGLNFSAHHKCGAG